MIKNYFAVASSNITHIGYSWDDHVLAIRFKNAEYHYSRFTANDWARFCGSDSFGKHFHAHIKGKFDFVKL